MIEQKQDEKKVNSISPKLSFIMGALAGIALVSLVGFIFSMSLLKSGGSTNSNTSKVAGAENKANVNTQPTNTNTAVPDPPSPVDIKITADDHIRGDKNAKVTLVAYSDYQCPYCARVEPTLNQILTDYKGKVRLVFRNFPLSGHANAQKAAEAAECAGDQNKFWEMHDKLFASQSDLSVDNYKKWAKELGLNSSKFDSCLDTGKYADRVKNQEAEAAANFGVQGTPASFVNGQMIVTLSNNEWSSGALPYEIFKQFIDNAIAGKPYF